jgi:hypothetical protein
VSQLDRAVLERLYRAVTLAHRKRAVRPRHGSLETTAWIHIAIADLERVDDACSDLVGDEDRAVARLELVAREETPLKLGTHDPEAETRALRAARYELISDQRIVDAIRELRSRGKDELVTRLVAFTARRAAGLNLAVDAADRHLAGWWSARRLDSRLRELSPFEVHGHGDGGHQHVEPQHGGAEPGHGDDDEHGHGGEHPGDCGCVDHEPLVFAYAGRWLGLAEAEPLAAAPAASLALAAGPPTGQAVAASERSTASPVVYGERPADELAPALLAPGLAAAAAPPGVFLTPCSPTVEIVREPDERKLHVWVTLAGGPRTDATKVDVRASTGVSRQITIRARELEALASLLGPFDPGSVVIGARATIGGQPHDADPVTIEAVPEYRSPAPHVGGVWEKARVEAHEQVDACTPARWLAERGARVRGHSGAVLTRAYNAGVVGTQLCLRRSKTRRGVGSAIASVACVLPAVSLGLVKLAGGLGLLVVGIVLSSLAGLVRLPCRLLGKGTREEVTSRLKVVGIHGALLRTGKVLLTGYDEGVFPVDRDHPADGSAVADSDRGLCAIWDPTTGRADYTPSLKRNKFCAHHAFLPDGRLLVASGQFPLPGLLKKLIPPRLLAPGADRDVELFDPVSETWTRMRDMKFGRWYPTCVSLPDGRVFIAAGTNGYATTAGLGRGPQQTYEYADTDGDVGEPIDTPFVWHHNYPFGLLLPSGLVFTHAKRTTRLLDPGNGIWSRIAPAVDIGAKPGDTLWPYSRTGQGAGTCALLPLRPERRGGEWVYPPGRVVILGGGGAEASPEPDLVGEDYKLHHNTPATRTVEILDLSEPEPRWRWAREHMANGHVMSDSVLLPDGTVLVVGGGRFGKSGGLLAHFASVELEGKPDKGAIDPILDPELFDPETETWRTLARKPVGRLYHTTALLLADGRVLSAGHDGALNMVPYDKSEYELEIFSPPYLFRPDGSPAPRPVIESGPDAVGYGEQFELRVEGTVREVTLIRPSAVTHQINTEQRWVGLGLDPGSAEGTFRATAPGTPNVAPPGWYMLFVVDEDGTPSVAHWLHLR